MTDTERLALPKQEVEITLRFLVTEWRKRAEAAESRLALLMEVAEALPAYIATTGDCRRYIKPVPYFRYRSVWDASREAELVVIAALDACRAAGIFDKEEG
jgi:hypothetical protein